MALGPGVEVNDRQAPGASPAEGAGAQPRCGPGAGTEVSAPAERGRTDPGRRRADLPAHPRLRRRALEPYWQQIGEKSEQWRAMPLDQLPAAEVRGFVNLWSGKLRQLEFGTRRKTCDWNYPLPEERLNMVEILLPDAQSMRQWGRLLALKARVEIAEGSTTRPSRRSRPAWPSAAMSVGDPS